ncbi:MAG: PIN domain-containing protein [Oscillospiraceae bacterium]|nr:PIN domain-containing protein [Oscillospiraceae bacterium]
MTYALDTNTVSYWIQNNKQVIDQLNNILRRGNTIIIPPIVYYEIRRGFKHKTALGKELAFSLICKTYEIGKMDLTAWEEAANIYGYTRKAGKPVEDTDILIAAFCIVNGYTLVTHNTKHFQDIKDLSIADWAK